MIGAFRRRLNTPSAKYGLALAMLSGGLRLLVETIREDHQALEELVELHADTRTRVFAFETIEEGERVIDEADRDLASSDPSETDQTDQPITEENNS